MERDFYFSKLRDIETKCQGHDVQGHDDIRIVAEIMEIMYATQV